MTDPNSRHRRIDVRLRAAIESGTLPKDLLICGPAGTGKTRGILTVLHCLCADVPRLRVLIVRQTRASLSESALVTFEREVLPADGMEHLALGPSRRNRASYDYPNGSTIVLGGMNNPGRITSTWWDAIFPNEAIELEENAWEVLWSRLNRPGSDPRFGWLLGDTNPGDPSHWLKRRCDEGRTALWDTSFAANPGLRDARGWTADGARHIASLAKLRGTRRKRYFEGLWAAGEGQWFESFAEHHVSTAAGYRRGLPIHLAIDSGVHTAAVWFQRRETPDGTLVTVCRDHYSFNVPAYDNARAIIAITRELTGGDRVDRGVTDPAGNSATAIGPTVLGEYARAGLRGLESWPSYPGSVVDGLGLIESFVSVDPPGLLVHPDCNHLIAAFANYKRAKKQGQFVDRPADPQHSHEDLIDALRGGLQDLYPEGRRPRPDYPRIAARKVF